MGTLQVRHYPTKLFLNAADHTYVECGTGARGWSCWGGKSGGSLLRTASGSSKRADKIAGPHERAGITCYLVNGVCHQAANRIVRHAGITVDGARGYSLSVSLFGVLGRPRAMLGLCKAPFDEFPGVGGDLPECLVYMEQPPVDTPRTGSEAGRRDFEDAPYMAAVYGLIEGMDALAEAGPERLFEEQMQQFAYFVAHRMQSSPESLSEAYSGVFSARTRFEVQRLVAEDEFARNHNAQQFVTTFDALTLQFQDDVARELDGRDYVKLLDLPPEEKIVLSDPDAVERAYGGVEPRSAE